MDTNQPAPVYHPAIVEPTIHSEHENLIPEATVVDRDIEEGQNGQTIPTGLEFMTISLQRNVECSTKVWTKESWGLVRPNLAVFASASLVWFGLVVIAIIAVAGTGVLMTVPGADTKTRSLHSVALVAIIIGGIVPIFVGLPALSGVMVTAFRIFRDNNVALFKETTFGGFRRRYYWRLVWYSILSTILSSIINQIISILSILTSTLLLFTVPLVIEHPELSVFQCMKLSCQVVWKKFFSFLGFYLIIILVSMSGVIAVGLGLLVTIPVGIIAICHAYRDIFGVNGDLCYAFSDARIANQTMMNATPMSIPMQPVSPIVPPQ